MHGRKKTLILLCCHCDYTACILIQERSLLCLSKWPSFSLSDFCVNMFSRHSPGTMETSLPVMQRSVTTCISSLATPIDCSLCHYTKSNSNYGGNTQFQQICLCTHLFNSRDFTNYFNDMRYSVIKLATLIHLLLLFKANHFREKRRNSQT